MSAKPVSGKPFRPHVYPEDVEYAKSVTGNASQEVKEAVVSFRNFFMSKEHRFGDKIGRRMEVTEVSVLKKADEPEKLEGRVVSELAVETDMSNGGDNLHGGCAAYLIDVCGTLPIVAYNMTTEGHAKSGVSQVIDTVYHSPAKVGDKLRIVSWTLSVGSRSMVARTEIWNATHHRLVASGIHIKMEPSAAKPKAKL